MVVILPLVGSVQGATIALETPPPRTSMPALLVPMELVPYSPTQVTVLPAVLVLGARRQRLKRQLALPGLI